MLTVTGVNAYRGVTTVTGGTLQILSGKLPASNEYVGMGGTACLVQSGGINSVSPGDLNVAYNAGSSGTYTLTGGSLYGGDMESIGVSGIGSFTQTGGTNSTGGGGFGVATSGGSGTSQPSGSGLLSVPSGESIGVFGSGSFHADGRNQFRSG